MPTTSPKLLGTVMHLKHASVSRLAGSTWLMQSKHCPARAILWALLLLLLPSNRVALRLPVCPFAAIWGFCAPPPCEGLGRSKRQRAQPPSMHAMQVSRCCGVLSHAHWTHTLVGARPACGAAADGPIEVCSDWDIQSSTQELAAHRRSDAAAANQVVLGCMGW
jgi:hypothetical protein